VLLPRVARISLAPVKALALVHPDEVELGLDGARGDRCFHLVDADGRMLNGKRCGPLVAVRPAYDPSGHELRLTLPDGTEVAGRVALGEPVETNFFGRPAMGRIVEGPWAAALSELAGQPVTLVRPDVNGGAADRGHTVSLIGSASLADLAAQAGLDEPLDGRRFRMSIEVDGLPAYAEDAWVDRRVRLGSAVARVRGNVGRCAVTTHDPDRGVPDLDTLRLLAQHRADVPTTEPLPLGVWGEIVEPGVARLGDPVELLD